MTGPTLPVMPRRGACMYCVSPPERWAGSVVLLEQDERWAGFSSAPAFYLHNLTAHPDLPGAGRLTLRRAEQLARQRGKVCLRLDSQADNIPLTRLYESEGYRPVGTCQAGAYRGILREKSLTE